MERASRLPGAVVWTDGPGGPGTGRVLPDGCMNLLWHDGRLLVAGPDTRAYVTGGSPGGRAGLRFFPGQATAAELGLRARQLHRRRTAVERS